MSGTLFSSSDVCLERVFAVDSFFIDMCQTPSLWNRNEGRTKYDWLQLIEDDNKLDGWYGIFDEKDEICNAGEEDSGTKSTQQEQQPILFYPHEMQEFTVTFPISIPLIMESSITLIEDGVRDVNHHIGTSDKSNGITKNPSSISFRLLQAWSAFGATGDDDTGLVLWGASVTLCQFLISEHEKHFMEQESKMFNDGSLGNNSQQQPSKYARQENTLERKQRAWVQVQGRTVLELGCGSALPSLVAYRLGSKRVIATDFRRATLSHVSYHAEQNNCRSPTFEVASLDWENHLKNRSQDTEDPEQQSQRHDGSGWNEAVYSRQVDIILAADVIYGTSWIPALVATIDTHLRYNDDIKTPSTLQAAPVPPPPQVVIATRDGRRGIKEFRQLITSPRYDFVEVFAQSYNNQDYAPFIPSNLQQDDLSLSRWNGNHSIYIYQRAG